MSRFSDYESDDDSFNGNAGSMWEKRAELALKGRRGRRVLAEIREALMALPEHRLVESALCKPRLANDAVDDAAIVGYDVCIIGARVWYEKVKAGMDPVAAFESMPDLTEDDDYNGQETAEYGRSTGMTYTLAWELAHMNDEDYAGLNPEERWSRFVSYIDSILRLPPLKAAPRRVRRVRQPKAERAARNRRPLVGTEPIKMGL